MLAVMIHFNGGQSITLPFHLNIGSKNVPKKITVRFFSSVFLHHPENRFQPDSVLVFFVVTRLVREEHVGLKMTGCTGSSKTNVDRSLVD
jgi:hypothetical protein